MSASTAEREVEARLAVVAQALLLARRGGPAADAEAMAARVRSAEEAYRVQSLVTAELEAAAPGARYWKSGGPSRDAVLTHAPLIAGGVWRSPVDAADHPFRLRVIEAEIALRLGSDVTPAQAATLPHDRAPALVDAMTVSIEVVDSRWAQGLQAPAVLKLADLQSHGALVLGQWVPFHGIDWAAQRCEVRIGDAAPQLFRGSHSLGDPCWLLPAWLKHATRTGDTVAAGTVVTTGTWCGMLPAEHGDAVRVAFDGIGEAALQF